MSQQFAVIGKRVTQPDAISKATGIARYTTDIKLPGVLIGRVLRSIDSELPFSRLTKILLDQ